jgi:phosphonate transport system ATP-binding protein
MNAAMPEAVIDIRHLRVQAGGRQLLNVPAFAVAAGERVALVGPNGAGKSTLLKVVGGLMPATAGHVHVLGRCFGGADAPPKLTRRKWRELRAEVGQMMQGLHLVPRLTAEENVVLGALARPAAMPLWRSWFRWYPPALREEARDALADLGLAHRLHARADQLSGGERQKVSLARLRLQQPRLILADEPTSALDPAATQQACQALLAVSHQATLLTVVHDPALLPLLADRVVGLKNGQVAFDVPVSQLNAALLEQLYAETQECMAKRAMENESRFGGSGQSKGAQTAVGPILSMASNGAYP